MGEIWQRIVDCWELKAYLAGIVSCLTFLVGDITAAPFIALWLLVIIDTVTRWMALGKKALDAHQETGSVWYGIYLAFLDKSINSNAMRTQFQSKCLAYLILLIGFNLLDRIVPDRLFGQMIDGMPNAFISTWLALVELQSIVENLIDMGMDGLTPLAGWMCRKRQKMTENPAQMQPQQPQMHLPEASKEGPKI